jgi:hypothetical protein
LEYSASLEENLSSAQRFQKFVAIPEFDLDFVVNTEQTGCECRVNMKCTLTHIGERAVEVNIGNINKVTLCVQRSTHLQLLKNYFHQFFGACKNQKEHLNPKYKLKLK